VPTNRFNEKNCNVHKEVYLNYQIGAVYVQVTELYVYEKKSQNPAMYNMYQYTVKKIIDFLV
jgi:hypothetical protein